MTLWIRPRGGNYPIDAAMLAVMGDYLPGGIGNAVGLPTFGTSLENTILFGLVEPTEWVMCDIRIALVQHGFAHGTMNMFSEGARLMAVGSQSVIVRERQPRGSGCMKRLLIVWHSRTGAASGMAQAAAQAAAGDKSVETRPSRGR